MAKALEGMRVAFLVSNEGAEQVELQKPWDAIKAEGGQPELIAPKAGKVQAMNHLDKGDSFPVDRTTTDARVEDYDAVVLPGGVANPDQLRMDKPAVQFVKNFIAAGKPLGVICHGPWTLVEAGSVRDRTLTSWPSLQTDIRNAGGNWVDAEVQVCDRGPNILVSSRKPDDLPAFCNKLIDVFQSQRTRTSAA